MTQIRFENMDMLIFVVSVGFVVVSLSLGNPRLPARDGLTRNAQPFRKLLLTETRRFAQADQFFIELQIASPLQLFWHKWVKKAITHM